MSARDGDAALGDYTARFDRLDLGAGSLASTRRRSMRRSRRFRTELHAALDFAAPRIEAFHRAQMPWICG